MTMNDEDYYKRRAAAETSAAAGAADPAVARVHRELANLYAERLAPQSRSRLHIVADR